MLRDSPETYNFKTRVGPLLFDVFLDDTFSLGTAPKRFNPHNHASFEAHFIIGGTGRLALYREEIPLQPGTCHVIPPGVYHAVVSERADPLRKYTLRFNYTELGDYDLYFPANEVASLKAALSRIGYFAVADREGDCRSLGEINEELERKSLGYYAKIQSILNRVLIHLLRAGAGTAESLPVYGVPRRLGNDSHASIIEEFFDHYDSNLSLADLAAQLGLSPRQTNRILQQRYRASFRQKLADIRMEDAKDRLQRTDATVAQIAEQL
ncbi:MAG: AraC family ligand binding domain-containing protein, partial [Paenibacillaceae bacterium]|nr:AraC family ligand binding domain-containing protein [Paenibacillaceae bacterium]